MERNAILTYVIIKCVKKIFYETSHKRGIDFKSLKVDWKKIIG